MKLYNGDCLEVMKSIPNKSIDAIITDPPYGTTACKWDSVIPFEPMWEQLNRIIKDNGAIVLFGSEPFSSALRMSNINNYKYDWVWYKNTQVGIGLVNKQPMRSFESIIVFYKKQCLFNAIKMKSRHGRKITQKNGSSILKKNGEHYSFRYSGDRTLKEYVYPRNVIDIKAVGNQNSKRIHPTQKPVALMEYLIKTYTNELETVLDFTMGSGTTGVACCNTNRDFIGIELDKEYFKIAQDRIKNKL